MSDQNPQPDQNGRTVLIILGAVLIFVGLSNLGGSGLSGLWTTWRPFGWFLGQIGEWALPALVITGGILLVVFSGKAEGNVRLPSKGDRLYRSRSQRMLGGVMGGFAEYFSVDPTLLRLGVVVLALLTEAWPVIVIYIAAVIIVPETPAQGVDQP